ncbi:hypothetical protein [Streptomyces vinaceus]|uniref:hypothetical protein n=1 Tax=Streptomyces vinaceus TaxID=1960 RepID=UPI003677DD09
MALTVGELVARIDADDSGMRRGLSSAELQMRGFQQTTDGTLRRINGRFASVGDFRAAELRLHGFVETASGELRTLSGELASMDTVIDIDGDTSGLRRATADAQASVDQFTRDANGRLRDLNGRFVASGEQASTSLGRGDRDARRFRISLAGLGSAIGSLGPAAMMTGKIGAGLGAAIPIAAGLVATLQGIAPAAGIGATAVFMLGQAVGAVKLGTSGIGEAITASGKAAAAAASTAKATASAQQTLSDAVKSAARANEQAVRRVQDAERGLTDAQRTARAAQLALNDARQQGARDLEDLNNQLASAELDQRDAVLEVADAQAELAKARAAGDFMGIERAQLAYERAVQRLKEQTTQTARLREETAAANKAGVEGTDAVRQAQERITDTQRTLADRERDVADARQEAARTAADGIEQIRRAQQALAEAGAGGADPFAEAMAKLAPAAREFVQAVLALKPAWEALRLDVQQTFMRGLADELTRTAGSVLPVLRRGLVDSAGALNLMGRGVLAAARDLADSGVLGQAMASASAGLRNLSRAPGQVVTGLGQVAAAAGPVFARLTDAAGGALDRLAVKMADSFESGGMQRAIDQAISLIGDLADVVGNVGSIIGSLFQSAQTSGGGFLGVLKEVTDAIAKAFASPEAQAGLGALYSTISEVARIAGPLLVDALKIIGSVFAELGEPAKVLVRALGDGLRPVVQALGPVLVSAASAVGALVSAAAPLLPVAGQLIAALLPALTPLLDLLAQTFRSLAPVVQQVAAILLATLTPVLAQLPPLVTALADGLSGGLAASVQVTSELLVALAPSLIQISTVCAELLVAVAPLIQVLAQLCSQILIGLMPLIRPLISIVGELAAVFAGRLAETVRTVVVPAIQALVSLLSGDLTGAGEHAKAFLRGLGSLALSSIGDLSTLLWRAGQQILGGLINGLRSMVPSLKEHLGWITSMLPDWKGPPETDARILAPAGESLIAGLRRGISAATPGLRNQLGSLTGALPGMVLPVTAGAAGAVGGAGVGQPQQIVITFEGGMAPLLNALQKEVKSRGGSVQAVLGNG